MGRNTMNSMYDYGIILQNPHEKSFISVDLTFCLAVFDDV
jgi:hypothetical protein